MLSKISRLKLRKRRNDYGGESKMCQNCRRDYKDTDNFNWSCRTHQSQWSGEMWWCCGKTSKEAPGCKFNKHEMVRDDEDEKMVNNFEQMFEHL